MMQQEEKHIAEELARQWDITLTGVYTSSYIIDILALKLAAIAEQGPDSFFQLMYRLDIPEKRLTIAMHDKNAIHEIATMVYNRQLQKIRSRNFYKNSKPDDESLRW